MEVKIKVFLNYLLELPWLLDGSVRNVFRSSFNFYRQLPDYKSQMLTLCT